APLPVGAARVHRPAGPAQAETPVHDSGGAALAAPAASRVRVRRPLRAPVRSVRRAAAAAGPGGRPSPGRLPSRGRAEEGAAGDHHPPGTDRGSEMTGPAGPPAAGSPAAAPPAAAATA